MLSRAGGVTRLRRTLAVAERLPYRAAAFDLVILGYALRHLDDLASTFAELRRVLRPGGTLLVLELGRPASRIGTTCLRFYMTRLVPFLARNEGSRTLLRYTWDTIDACVDSAAILGALRGASFVEVREVLRIGPLREYVGRR
jgi:demethylmenaquinone methyltransferase/2-methoxy-6-polyprenyl-1,4-benzoquinol methylase